MSKLFSSSQIKKWDQHTIIYEPISGYDLMERAAFKCVHWLVTQWPDKKTKFSIFCGNGNNGGDGLAIARLLLENAYSVDVYLVNQSKRSQDNQTNLNELRFLLPPCIHFFDTHLSIPEDHIIIDSIFGTGLNKTISGIENEMILFMNKCVNIKVSIDLPSGMDPDSISISNSIVHADYTLTFQNYKRSFLFPETGKFCGKIIVLDIKLASDFLKSEISKDYIINTEYVKSLHKKRQNFSHKGNHGHLLMIAGSRGMMGAAYLASKSALRAGAGLVSILIPENENSIIQSTLPEAITIPYESSPLFQLPSLDTYDAIAIGCGLGTNDIALSILEQVFRKCSKALVIDADALNLLSMNKELMNMLPENSLLTPHPKEFIRLFGDVENSMERNKLQIEMSKKYKIFIVLKGHFSSLSTPMGECYFNTTGNAGMAKGGSGDVLTGIIAGLFAQYRNMETAGLMGLYLHGLAGDLAVQNNSVESIIASDIIHHLGQSFRQTFYE